MSRAAAIVVGIVLLAAGALKLRDERWPEAARALGTPRVLVPAVAPAELVLGGLLAAGVAPRVTGTLAAALFAVFTVALVRVLRRGDAPVCSCFGSWSARPVSWRSVGRNVALTALAVFAAAGS